MKGWSLLTKVFSGLLIIGTSGGGAGIGLGSIFKEKTLENKESETQNTEQGLKGEGNISSPEAPKDLVISEGKSLEQKSSIPENPKSKELTSEKQSDGSVRISGSSLGDFQCRRIERTDGSIGLACS
ncbi:hypothetical protein [Mycoplasma suis]|uniref:Uncharacterized protein n=2 Tax=Mycoplasma suis TaxID=57372 RepID=F0QS13_MYCSL|nr:hypothetical protein [Mycoplasma suis]ADX98283.1 hypothetical protein MSU_0758 [Mycoplasma suis str. Illinois]CBZ40799.1 hypothetical protein MSUIS_07060 [Mycoplasma suis KI3806]